MKHKWLSGLAVLVILGLATSAGAVSSAELYQSPANLYGRFEARIRFAAGDGVISSFFLWKAGSEAAGAFWNELDFEKLGADCHLQTNALFGAPVADHSQTRPIPGDLCVEYHTYAFEWTPTSIAFLVDGVEIRRDIGATATAFAQNATAGMQMHFNIWPGDATFGGNFSPAILPVHQYISWVQYSSFANGTFSLQWREEFDGGTLPAAWSVANWASPKNLSTHVPANATFVGAMAELSLTADNETGFTGQPPADNTIGDSGVQRAGDSEAGGQSGSSDSGGSGGRNGLGGGGSGGGSDGSTIGGGAGGARTSSPDSGTAGQGTGGTFNASGGAPITEAGSGGNQPPTDGTSAPVGNSGCACRMPVRSHFGNGTSALALALATLLASRRLSRRVADRAKSPAQ